MADTQTGSPLPNPQDNVKPKDYRKEFQRREAYTQFVDPCEDASRASMKCLDKNNYNREKCLDFFEAYRDCKKTWIEQKKADRRAGKPPVI